MLFFFFHGTNGNAWFVASIEVIASAWGTPSFWDGCQHSNGICIDMGMGQKPMITIWLGEDTSRNYSCFSKGRGRSESNTVIFDSKPAPPLPPPSKLPGHFEAVLEADGHGLTSCQVSRQSVFSISKSHHVSRLIWTLAFVHSSRGPQVGFCMIPIHGHLHIFCFSASAGPPRGQLCDRTGATCSSKGHPVPSRAILGTWGGRGSHMERTGWS